MSHAPQKVLLKNFANVSRLWAIFFTTKTCIETDCRVRECNGILLCFEIYLSASLGLTSTKDIVESPTPMDKNKFGKRSFYQSGARPKKKPLSLVASLTQFILK
jgi:hypothetical protein